MHEDAPELDVPAICATLQRHGVEFVTIGGVAAILHGAPLTTLDFDIVPADLGDNLARLTRALVAMDAEVRFAGRVRGFPDGEWLHAAKTWNFRTRFGDFDILFAPSGSAGYDSLRTDAETAEVDGRPIEIASLSALIAMKEAAGRAKDLQALPILKWLRDSPGQPLPEGESLR